MRVQRCSPATCRAAIAQCGNGQGKLLRSSPANLQGHGARRCGHQRRQGQSFGKEVRNPISFFVRSDPIHMTPPQSPQASLLRTTSLDHTRGSGISYCWRGPHVGHGRGLGGPATYRGCSVMKELITLAPATCYTYTGDITSQSIRTALSGSDVYCPGMCLSVQLYCS